MTTADTITLTIEHRAADILDLVRLGWSKEAATAYIRETSMLGPKGWERVMEIINR